VIDVGNEVVAADAAEAEGLGARGDEPLRSKGCKHNKHHHQPTIQDNHGRKKRKKPGVDTTTAWWGADFGISVLTLKQLVR
jgi:hypothetical protein